MRNICPAIASVDEEWIPTNIQGLECTASGWLRYTADRKHVRTRGPFKGTPVWGYSRLRGRYIKALQVRDPKTNRMVNVGRVILEAFGFKCPKGYEVHHRNFDPSMNFLGNICFINKSANLRLRRAYVKSETPHSRWLLSQKEKHGVNKLYELPVSVRREYWRKQKAYLRMMKYPMKQVA